MRKLAAALGPAYLRVSGTWANATWFQDADGATPTKPPAGFNAILTREQWNRVVDFAHAVNAEIITSFAMSDGTRNAQGLWTPEQARALLSYTKSIGGRIAAAEFMNEPNAAGRTGAPKGYDAAAYARDIGLSVRSDHSPVQPAESADVVRAIRVLIEHRSKLPAKCLKIRFVVVKMRRDSQVAKSRRHQDSARLQRPRHE